MRTRFGVAFIGICLIVVTSLVVVRDLRHAREQSQDSELTAGQQQLDPIAEPESPFLEDQPPTTQNEHALLEEGGEEEPLLHLLGDRDASEKTSSEGQTPAELPVDEDVDPVPLLTPQQRAENSAVIRKIMPDISDEQLEFWLEETRDLPPNMISQMLTLRKQFGGLSDQFNLEDHPLVESPPANTDRQTDRHNEDQCLRSLAAARSSILQNMLNEKSIGYRAVELKWIDGAPSGVRLARTEISTEPGRMLRTERTLDVAIRNPSVFLAVTSDEEEWLTRYGSLEIGPDLRLRLAVEGLDLIVSPGIQIPEGATDLEINGVGLVTALDGKQRVSLGQLDLREIKSPQFLKPVGTARYQVTRQSGPARDFAPKQPQEVVLSGNLERSNVNYKDQEAQLRMIERMLTLREQQLDALQANP